MIGLTTWLKTTNPLSVFVENRTKEILKEKDVSFRYIASDQNPADLAARGSSISEISKSSLGWNGPPWLKEEDSLWPMWNTSEITPGVLEQV